MSPRKASRKRGSQLTPARYLSPMKALGVGQVPSGQWCCEMKYDGYRAVAVLNDGEVALWSRTEKSMTAAYPEIGTALGRLNCRNAVLDGEIVALDEVGRSRFQLLQRRDLGESAAPIVYYVFDLMHLDGESLVDQPLQERQRRLRVLLGKPKNPLQMSPSFSISPQELMEAARQQGLEGIIAKRKLSPYEPGRRSGAWLKCKILGEQEFVIGGFTPPQNSRRFFGAILVGYFQGGKLMYAGKVGTGFDGALLERLNARFMKRKRATCPFANLPLARKSRFGTGMTRTEMSKVTWIKPDLVAQIKFAEWTHDGLLRQPVFLGLRVDKPARQVRREAPPVPGSDRRSPA